MARARAVIKTSTPFNPKGGLLRTRHYFQIIAGNGEPLCTSEMYASKSNAARGVRDLAESMHGVLDISDE